MAGQQDVQGTTKYIQVNENAPEQEKWIEINRALRYVWEQLASLKGSLGTPKITADLDLTGHKAINAANPTANQDLVTKLYADSTYVAKSTSANPGLTGAPSSNPGTSGGSSGSGGATIGTASATKQLVRWDTVSTLGSARLRDDDTYIIVGTGTTDAALTANALVVGSSGNAGDLAVVRTGLNSEMIRLLPGSSVNVIASDRTGAGTYRDMVFNVNGAEGARLNTGGDFIAQRDVIAKRNLKWSSGTGLVLGTLVHANKSNRAYFFPDVDANMIYETTGSIGNGNFVWGGPGVDEIKDSGFTVVPLLYGGTGATSAPGALASLGAAATGAAGAHTITLLKLTGGGSNGSITWNADGCVTAWVDPT